MVPQPQWASNFKSVVQRAAAWDAQQRPGKAVPAHLWEGADAFYLGALYDAMYVLAVAADATARTGGKLSNGTALMERLLNTSVEGMTGPVSFDANGDNMVSWVGLNVQNRTMVPVLLYSPSSKLLLIQKPVVWPGSTTVVPVDYDSGLFFYYPLHLICSFLHAF